MLFSTLKKMKNQLLSKIKNKEITVGVVGLGYVGLPLAVEKAKAGFKTIGFDVQEAKVALVNKGENYIGDVVDDDLKAIVDNGMLRATTDFSFVKDVDFIAICVPTLLTVISSLTSAMSSPQLNKSQSTSQRELWSCWNQQLIQELRKNS